MGVWAFLIKHPRTDGTFPSQHQFVTAACRRHCPHRRWDIDRRCGFGRRQTRRHTAPTLIRTPAASRAAERKLGSAVTALVRTLPTKDGISRAGVGEREDNHGPYVGTAIEIYDDASGGLVSSGFHPTTIEAIMFSPSGRSVLSGGVAGELVLWTI
jgi:hypothetical protein